MELRGPPPPRAIFGGRWAVALGGGVLERATLRLTLFVPSAL